MVRATQFSGGDRGKDYHAKPSDEGKPAVLVGADGTPKEIKILHDKETHHLEANERLHFSAEGIAGLFKRVGVTKEQASKNKEVLQGRIQELKQEAQYKGSFFNVLGRIRHYLSSSALRTEIKELRTIEKSLNTSPEMVMKESKREIQRCLKELKKLGVPVNENKLLNLDAPLKNRSFPQREADLMGRFGFDLDAMPKSGTEGRNVLKRAYFCHQNYQAAKAQLEESSD